MSTQTTPIVRKKLGDQVFELLLDRIESGDLQPGYKMSSERDLMVRYNVGQPAVREAMQLLQNKGLIVISHGERSKVNKLSGDSAINQIVSLFYGLVLACLGGNRCTNATTAASDHGKLA